MEILGLSLVMFIIGIIFAIAWIITMVKQLSKGRWLWFILTLIFPIVMVLYWIFG